MAEQTEKTYDVSKAREAQSKYIREHNEPQFSPPSGTCWRCKKNIYEQIDHGSYISGISVEEASTRLITGCPHCHRSYLD